MLDACMCEIAFVCYTIKKLIAELSQNRHSASCSIDNRTNPPKCTDVMWGSDSCLPIRKFITLPFRTDSCHNLQTCCISVQVLKYTSRTQLDSVPLHNQWRLIPSEQRSVSQLTAYSRCISV